MFREKRCLHISFICAGQITFYHGGYMFREKRCLHISFICAGQITFYHGGYMFRLAGAGSRESSSIYIDDTPPDRREQEK